MDLPISIVYSLIRVGEFFNPSRYIYLKYSGRMAVTCQKWTIKSLVILWVQKITIPNANDSSIEENWNLDDPKRRESLYANFNMSDDQIQKYEKAIDLWKGSVQGEEAYELLSANEKIKKEDSILKSILNESQYERYKKWARANDLRG